MGIIDLGGTEESFQGVVARQDEAGKVDKEGTSKVEEDKEEVQATQGEDHVDLGHTSLLLKVVENLILGELEAQKSVTRSRERSEIGQASVGIFAA